MGNDRRRGGKGRRDAGPEAPDAREAREAPNAREAREASAAAPPEPGASTSGSIEVELSSPTLPAAPAPRPPELSALEEPTDVSRAPTTEAAQGAQAALEPLPEAPDPDALEPEPPHARSSALVVAKRAEELLGQGVSKLGEGIDTIGRGVSKIGERAARVPVLGESVRNLGEGLSEVGASLHELPAVTKSRRGRILVRSMVVAFLLVFAWISAIVMLQLRDSKKPDFRPLSRRILLSIRDGNAAAVWADASPRFQEVVREQRFIDDMADMKNTLGAFREIAAVNETIVSTGPGGRIGRVALTLQFERGTARANVSFHRDGGRWKLLGLAVDTPPELPITQESRKERSELPTEVYEQAKQILQAADLAERSEPRESRAERGRPATRPPEADPAAERDLRSEALWDTASEVFHSSITKADFVRLQRERTEALGNYKGIIEYKSGSKKLGDLSATFTGLVEYQRAGVVSVAVSFARDDERAPWLLRSLKIVLPMPRLDEPVEAEVDEPDNEPVRPARQVTPRPARDAGAEPSPADAGLAVEPAPADAGELPDAAPDGP